MPPLTWSVSRDATLHYCERRYYYQYLVTARSNSRSAILREIALLKQLQSIPSWQGDCFHSVIGRWANSARAGTDMPRSEMLQQLRRDMTDQWQQSSSLVGRSAPSNTVTCRLFEHEYGLELPPERLPDAISEASSWIDAFLQWESEVGLANGIRTAKRCWIEPSVFGPGAPGFRLDGQQVLVKVDLALELNRGFFRIWDWKTGKLQESNPRRIDPAALQVNVYQLWPHLQMSVALENIRAHLVYFSRSPAEDIVHEIDADVREFVMSVVRRSIDRVIHFSGKDGVELQLEDFDYAFSPGLCRSCNFKRICLRSLEED